MPEKKEQNKFTIQFNAADPSHRQVADVLNRQGRRKAQFLVNAVQHYLHCPETPDIPQAEPTDTRVIEELVRRILEEQGKTVPTARETENGRPAFPRSESVRCDGAEELLGEKGWRLSPIRWRRSGKSENFVLERKKSY